MANYSDPGTSTRSNYARKISRDRRNSRVHFEDEKLDASQAENAKYSKFCPECKETFNVCEFVEHLYTHLPNGNNNKGGRAASQAAQTKDKKVNKKNIHTSATSTLDFCDEEDDDNETLNKLQKMKQNYSESDYVIQYQCSLCNEYCTTEYKKKMHRNKMHPSQMNVQIFVKKLVLIESSKQVPQNNQPITRTLRSTKTLNSTQQTNATHSQHEEITRKRVSETTAAPAKVQRRRMTNQEKPVIEKRFERSKIQRRSSRTTKAPEKRPSFSEPSDSDQSADEEVPNAPARQVPQNNPPKTRTLRSTQTLNSTQQMNTTQSQQEETTRKRKSESNPASAKVQRRRMTYQEKPVIDKRIKRAKIQRRRSTTTKAPEERPSISEPSDSDQSADEEVPNAPVKYTLYKCHCAHHFMTTETFTEHLKKCKPNSTVNANSRECAGCGLRFLENELENHNKNRLFCCNEVPDFEIIKMEIQNIQNSKYRPKSKTINTTKNLNKEKHTERVFNEETSTGGKPKLYQCAFVNCSATFLVQSALKTHISLELHDALVKLKCDKCNLLFGSTVLNKHRKQHHGWMNLHSSTDYEILCYFNNDIHSALVPVSSPNVHLGIEAPERNDNQRKGKLIILYKCKICDIHYTMESSIRRHLQLYKNKVHDVKRTTICGICNLKFTVSSLSDHNNEVHHSGSNMENYKFQTIELPKDNTDAGCNQNGDERRGVNDRVQENTFPTNRSDPVNEGKRREVNDRVPENTFPTNRSDPVNEDERRGVNHRVQENTFPTNRSDPGNEGKRREVNDRVSENKFPTNRGYRVNTNNKPSKENRDQTNIPNEDFPFNANNKSVLLNYGINLHDDEVPSSFSVNNTLEHINKTSTEPSISDKIIFEDENMVEEKAHDGNDTETNWHRNVAITSVDTVQKTPQHPTSW